jgi:hypothetical protein
MACTMFSTAVNAIWKYLLAVQSLGQNANIRIFHNIVS